MQASIKTALLTGSQRLIGSASSQLDSEVLLAHVLKKDRSYLRAWPERVLTQEEYKAFIQLINQRLKGQPIAYLLGEKEFWSRSFSVSPEVLIPRPETELLIEIIQQTFQPEQPLSILDLGTGSGAIAITLAGEFTNADIIAIDQSATALSVAQLNARRHNAQHIQFICSDWFEKLPAISFDLIVSNPPYICSSDPHLQQGDVRFEPSTALTSKQHGLHDIKHIISKSASFLNPNGYLLLEHGYQQGNDVKNLLDLAGFKCCQQFQDLQGHCRATIGQKNNHSKEQ